MTGDTDGKPALTGDPADVMIDAFGDVEEGGGPLGSGGGGDRRSPCSSDESFAMRLRSHQRVHSASKLS